MVYERSPETGSRRTDRGSVHDEDKKVDARRTNGVPQCLREESLRNERSGRPLGEGQRWYLWSSGSYTEVLFDAIREPLLHPSALSLPTSFL